MLDQLPIHAENQGVMRTSEPTPVAVLVEDERQLRRAVRNVLEAEGWRVFESETAVKGMIEASTRKPDLVVLDLGLPDGHGVDFLRELRQWSEVPVIVLSAFAEESDKVEALDAGADDYLTKPFSVGEFLARVRATQRRRLLVGGSSGPAFRFGDVEVNLTARSVRRRDELIHLTPIEYRLLALLIAAPGRILTHRQISRHVWGPGHDERAHHVRVYMRSLRQKLEDDPAQPRYIVTEAGVGYRLNV
jgi:two-component system KDP operon response regulator KdpE